MAFSLGGLNCTCCGGCATTITGRVRGCNSQNLVGATVEAHDSTAGGTLLGSTTTDSAGLWTLAVSGTAGNAIVIVASKARFTATTLETLAYDPSFADATDWTCGDTSDIGAKTLPIDTSLYVCGPLLCADPIKKTLFATVGGGSATLTYDAGTATWWGCASVSATVVTSVTRPVLTCICNTTTQNVNVLIEYDASYSTKGAINETWAHATGPSCQFCLDQSCANPGILVPPTVTGLCAGVFTFLLTVASTKFNAATLACPTSFSFGSSITSGGFGDCRDAILTGAVTVTE